MYSLYFVTATKTIAKLLYKPKATMIRRMFLNCIIKLIIIKKKNVNYKKHVNWKKKCFRIVCIKFAITSRQCFQYIQRRKLKANYVPIIYLVK